MTTPRPSHARRLPTPVPAAPLAGLAWSAAVAVFAAFAATASVSVAVAEDLPQEADWKGAPPGFLYFRHQLLPLMRSGCGSAGCHGGFSGGRLHLAPPLETGEYSNQAAQANYRSALQLVRPDARERSLLMIKVLRPDIYEKDRAWKGVEPPKPVVGACPQQVSPYAKAGTLERELYDALLDWVKGRRAANFAPIAYAGRDRHVSVKENVALDGGLSYDPNPEDQKRIRFQWTLLAKPEDSNAQLKAAAKVNPSITPDKPGAYVIRLVVEDPKRRKSDPSYVILTALGKAETKSLAELNLRTTEQHDLPIAGGKVSGLAKKVPDETALGKECINVDPKGKGSGDLSLDFSVKRPGKYGLWLLVKDKVGEEAVPRGPVGVAVDGRQQAVLPVPADDEFWRLVRFGGTTAVAGAAAGVWTGVSGKWEQSEELKRLVSIGRGLGLAGRNIADLGVDCEGQMLASFTVQMMEEYPVRNGYFVFDYKSPADYKIAGVELVPGRAGNLDGRLVIDWIGAPRGGPKYYVTEPADLEFNKDINVRVELVDDTVNLYHEGRKRVTQKFPAAFAGKMGLASTTAKTQFDNLFIWRNTQLVYANGFGDDPALGDDAAAGDDPTKRLKRKKLLSLRLTEGKHTLKLTMFPGAPDLEKAVVARIDSLAETPPAVRKTIRGIYIDLLGRGPTEEELARDAAKPPDKMVRDIVSSYEFWNWLYEEELLHLDLTDTYRPIDLDFDYITYPALLTNKKTNLKEVYRQLLTGVYFHAKNYGEEDYPRGLWQYLFGVDILDEPDALEAARRMYNGPDEGETKDAKAAKKPGPKKTAAAPKLFGVEGKVREDMIKIVLDQPLFAERLAARLYKRITGAEMSAADAKKAAAALKAGWDSGKEALPDIVAGWCSSPDYLKRTLEVRRKSNAAFVRTLYVDVLNRAPDFGEFWGAYRIIRSLSDSEPLRVIVAGMIAESEEADIPLKSEIVRSEWIREQILKLYCRDPKAGEVAGLDALLGRQESTTRLFIRALLTHPEYQTY
jgi:hypothetical protein